MDKNNKLGLVKLIENDENGENVKTLHFHPLPLRCCSPRCGRYAFHPPPQRLHRHLHRGRRRPQRTAEVSRSPSSIPSTSRPRPPQFCSALRGPWRFILIKFYFSSRCTAAKSSRVRASGRMRASKPAASMAAMTLSFGSPRPLAMALAAVLRRWPKAARMRAK